MRVIINDLETEVADVSIDVPNGSLFEHRYSDDGGTLYIDFNEIFDDEVDEDDE